MIRPVIAIDGPAGAGKSTIAKMVAERLNYVYIDTGAMYRAVTLKFLENKLPFADELVTEIAQKINITFKAEQGCNHVYADGKEVTEEIRSTVVTNNVSKISAIPGVREAMVSAQREIGSAGGVVMDGRDIGTVVFPQADVKIFLTASVEERAKRRYLELKNKGQNVNLEILAQEIAQRDKFDSERKLSPLRCADNAHYLDTSDLDIPKVVDNILHLCKVR
jgi:CMP/dCMP kinase